MNVFQDLVEELKGENLLEQTVIETNSYELQPETENPKNEIDDLAFQANAAKNFADFERNSAVGQSENAVVFNDEQVITREESSVSGEEAIEAASTIYENDPALSYDEQTASYTSPAPLDKAEFYRKRAIDEVSGLQMVEHVLSGVEREQMKLIPKSYDDLEVKKVLHRFLQVVNDLNSPEHAQVEFQLMQETESWYSALSHRDKHVSVAHLRRFCEMTRPHLSSQALIALARFYRNSPYSEPVRSKFDLILTRLLTKDAGNEKRKLTSTREHLIENLTSLYADWSSVPLYAASDDDSEILITTLKFEDFMAEAEAADNFDELIKNDFFNRLRVLKKSANENFFAPLVTATAIECNVRVGNRYVDLLRQEKEKLSESTLEDKYGFLHDQAISEATGKTLQLVELLKNGNVSEDTPNADERSDEVEQSKPVENTKAAAASSSSAAERKPLNFNLFGVNKWLLAATVLSIVLSIGLYFWANQYETPAENQANVKVLSLENSFLKDFLREAKVNKDTFYGFVLPAWDNLSKEKKEEMLTKIYALRNEKGFTKVHLLYNDGRTAGFVTEQKMEAF